MIRSAQIFVFFLNTRLPETAALIRSLQAAVVEQADKNAEVILPGYTHLQHAQPVLLGHHLMAYFWMLERDKGRLLDCLKRLDVLPLGSGALAGTTFPIDREYVARELDFASVSDNSIDSVSDRDFVSEFLAAAAIVMTHLSRFAEEIIIWNTSEFGFIELDDSVTTGSSIMPQKKNPDVAELVRGKSARVIGNLVSLLTLQKGLPLAYNRDLQEDKEPVFDTVDTLVRCRSGHLLLCWRARSSTPKECTRPREKRFPPRPTSPIIWFAAVCRSEPPTSRSGHWWHTVLTWQRTS